MEDQPADVLLVTRLLQWRGGVDLRVARTGVEAIRLAPELRSDVVLLDLHLSDLSGETVLRHLRAQPGFGATPVMVLSADASRASVERLTAAGVTAYLTKPLDVRAFFDHLSVMESSSLLPAVATAGAA